MTVLGWGVAFLVFFPILWMALASFKTEIDAVATPPKIFFQPTLENFADINERVELLRLLHEQRRRVGRRDGRLHPARGAGRLCDGVLPDAEDQGHPDVDAVHQDDAGGRRAGADLPASSINTGLLDTRTGIIIVYTLMNLPIVVWMLYSFFREVPKEILEAARMDGATPLQQLLAAAAAAVAARHHVDRAAVDHHLLERGVLEHQPHGRARRRR